MPSTRRTFLKQTGLAAGVAGLVGTVPHTPQSAILKPPRLQEGQTVGLISPASATYEPVRVEIMEETLAALGLETRRGDHILERWGYFAGSDEARAADINQMFADPDIDAVFALHGGWGAARTLPFLDYETIRQHPKILIGYSDITSLLIGLYAKTGLVTFHGPNGNSTWNQFSVDYLRQILFDAEAVTMQNPTGTGDNLAQIRDRVRTITPGTARGRLAGGNLTVLTSIIGSDYLPEWDGHILFLEDIGEDVYRVDRMLTQLKLAGVLDRLAGFIFGKCTDCDPDSAYSSFTLEEVLINHIQSLGIPAWHGAMIGHIEDKFTVPLGIEVEINAEIGTVRMLESAVL
jgi:muramoyltetrapeptide carboxypeptidase